MKRKIEFALCVGLVAAVTFAAPAESVVRVKPGESLQAARDAARKLPKPAVVELADGVWRLDETLVLYPEDSHVTWCAAKGAKPVVSGAAIVTGWRKTADGRALEAMVPVGTRSRLLSVGGRTVPRCGAPDTGYFDVVGESVTSDTGSHDDGQKHPDFFYDPKDLRPGTWSDPTTGEVIAYHWWFDSHLDLASVDTVSNRLVFATPARFRFSMSLGGKKARYRVENVYELMDTPGEWFLDAKRGRLCRLPLADEPKDAVVALARLERLVYLRAEPAKDGRFVENVVFRGIRFEQADAQLPPGDLNDEQASVGVPSAVVLEGAKGCAFEDCVFRDLAGYAVDIRGGSRRCAVRRCRLADLGAGGVRLDGARPMAHPFALTRENVVEDCEIGPYGLVYASGVGIFSMNAGEGRFAHNHIHDGFYTGISVGWSWGFEDTVTRGNIVECNHIHDIGKELLSDMGGIYTLGLLPGSVVRQNVIHDVRSWSYCGCGIYADEGTSGILFEKNLVYDTDNGFNVHFGREITCRNNVIARTRKNMLTAGFTGPYVTLYLYGNIFASDAGGIGWVRWRSERPYDFISKLTRTGDGGCVPGRRRRDDHVRSDYNLFWISGEGHEKDRWWATMEPENRHSVWADPKFVDPAHDDFRLRADSPAWALGFEAVDWAKCGPRTGR